MDEHSATEYEGVMPGIGPHGPIDGDRDVAKSNEYQEDLTTLSDEELLSRLRSYNSKLPTFLSAEELIEAQKLAMEVARRGSMLPRGDSETQSSAEREAAIIARMQKAFELAGRIEDDMNARAIMAVAIYNDLE